MEIIRNPGFIENKSMSIIDDKLPGLINLPEGERAIIKRIVHATGDFSIAGQVIISGGAVAAGLAAIKEGRPIMTDVNMLKAGLNPGLIEKFKINTFCLINDPIVIQKAKQAGITRAMVAMKEGARQVDGGIIAIGNAPTALFMVCEMIKEKKINPALVVGTPVGFVGAAESKDMLRQVGIEYITLPGSRGGSTIAAAIVNALLLLAADD